MRVIVSLVVLLSELELVDIEGIGFSGDGGELIISEDILESNSLLSGMVAMLSRCLVSLSTMIIVTIGGSTVSTIVGGLVVAIVVVVMVIVVTVSRGTVLGRRSVPGFSVMIVSVSTVSVSIMSRGSVVIVRSVCVSIISRGGTVSAVIIKDRCGSTVSTIVGVVAMAMVIMEGETGTLVSGGSGVVVMTVIGSTVLGRRSVPGFSVMIVSMSTV